jgi:hypothetical protein
MSCFSCFGPALEPQEGKKPVPADAAKDLRKDGSAPRGGGSGADLGIFFASGLALASGCRSWRRRVFSYTL